MSMEQPFEWKGEPMATYGDVSVAMWRIFDMEDEAERQHEADAFMEAYRKQTGHANENVGYLCGYAGHDEMVAALRLFKCSHPIFGAPDTADKVTPEEAFEKGKELGRRLQSGNPA